MDLISLFKLVVSKLEKLKIPYVVTGGIAVSFWGAPRTTHDIDIIIEIDASKKSGIIKAFRNDFYISREGIEGMLEHNISFNVIHNKTGLKVDFWPVDKRDPHKIAEFKRSVKKNIFGKKIFIITPEDLIVVKLQWFKDSNSSRHLEDVKSILQISKVDLKYIKKWTQIHETDKILENILEKTEKNDRDK